MNVALLAKQGGELLGVVAVAVVEQHVRGLSVAGEVAGPWAPTR